MQMNAQLIGAVLLVLAVGDVKSSLPLPSRLLRPSIETEEIPPRGTASDDATGHSPHATHATSEPLSGTEYITNGSRIDPSVPLPELLLHVTTHALINSSSSDVSESSSAPSYDQDKGDIRPPEKSHNASAETESASLNCTQTIVPLSFHRTVKCPNIQAFNDSGQKRGSLELEIEHVGGDLYLPGLSGGALVLILRINDANLTSINSASLTSTSQSAQTQMIQTIKKLDLNGNPDFDASSLANVGELPLLTHLYMRGTALSTLESQLPQLLKNLPNLEDLDVAFSEVHYLKGSDVFNNNKKLKYLDMAGNMLNGVAFSQDVVSHLKYLNMSGCGLRSIEVKEDPVVGTTHLTEYEEAPRNLQVLDVSRNQLNNLPSQLINALPTKCVILNIADNAWNESCGKCSLYYLWEYITTLSDDAIKCSNLLGTEDIKCFRRDEALFDCGWDVCPRGCLCDKRNKSVDCRKIGLENIPLVAPSSVEILLLQNNSLKDLRGIESPTWCNLKSLHLENNQINVLVPLGTQKHCRCHSEEDYYSDPQMCFPQNLKKLFLYNNVVHNITATDCLLLYPLQTLELSRNKISSACARRCGPLENLEVLDLSHNYIKNVCEPDFTCYPHMSKLNLSYNALHHMQSDVTSLMTNLKVLDLSHNNLTDFVSNLSAPETGLFTKKSGQLEILYLNNNNLSKVVCVLKLTEILSLKQVTLYDNPWSCYCEQLQPFWNILQSGTYPALYSARENMECAAPEDKKGTPLKTHKPQDCFKMTGQPRDEVFMTLVAVVLFVIICTFICHSSFSRRVFKRCCRRLTAIESPRVRRKFDCFVVSSSDDYELVRARVIIPLTQRGYSIAWYENAFTPGTWIIESIERAIRNSERMVVFASGNFVKSRWGRIEIRRGRNEEHFDDSFKVMALVTESLPRELNRDLFEIVALRTHLRMTDRDYIQNLCNFLPPPAPHGNQSDGLYMTETDIQAFVQTMRERMQQRQRQIIPSSELFHSNHENNHVTVNVDIATHSSGSTGNRQCRSLSTKDRSALIERFKVRAVGAPPQAPANTESTSLQYYLTVYDNDEDITDVLQEDNFIRGSITRTSCPIFRTDRIS